MAQFHHWLLMGGYAHYVWSAYAIGLFVIGAPLVAAIYHHRQVRRHLIQWYQVSDPSR